MINLTTGTSAVVALVGVALVVALFAERVQVPAGVAMVTVGLIAATFHPMPLPINFGDALLSVFILLQRCCTDAQQVRLCPTHGLWLCDTYRLRATESQHPVQHVNGDSNFGNLIVFIF
jgi:hypothetical protein